MFGPLRRHPGRFAWGLVAVVFAVDLCLPLGVASAVPYTFAVLLALAAKPGWVGPAVAGVCAVLTVAKMEIVPERGTTEMWKVVTNRCLALFAIGMTTALGLLRRRAEARTRQHEADLNRLGRLAVAGELATVLAHELNQPLTAVCVQADLAARLAADGGDAELSATLGEVAGQAQRAAEIVRTIRRAVRGANPDRGPVDLNAAAEEVARLLAWKAGRAGVTVQLRPDAALLPTFGDRVQLEQIVFNLLQNAIEAVAARPDGARAVTVETAAVADEMWVIVRDTGAGIADPDRLFEQFYTTKPDGMGLGLAISRSAAEAHGGRLTGRNVDGGAEFTLVLPAYLEEHG